MKQKSRAVDGSKGQQQFRGFVQERVVLLGVFAGFCEVFGGEDVGIGRGEEGCGFIVGLVRTLSRGSGFPRADCERGIARF